MNSSGDLQLHIPSMSPLKLCFIPLKTHLEVRRRLHLPDRLHQRVPHDDRDVSARVSVRALGQLPQILLGEDVRGVAEMDLEHGESRVFLRQRNVDPLLEAPSDGGVEDPRDVGGAEHEDAVHIVAHALHLHQELGLDPTRTFALVLGTRRAQRVHLVDEDDAGLVSASQLEEISHELLGLAEPLRHQIGRADREEGRVVGLGGYGFGQV